MAKQKRAVRSKKPIEQHDHRDKKRLNNPPSVLIFPYCGSSIGNSVGSFSSGISSPTGGGGSSGGQPHGESALGA